MQRLVVQDADALKRLDVFLSERLSLSRREAQRLLERGLVGLEHQPDTRAVKGTALEPGAHVLVASFVPEAEMRVKPEPDAPLSVLQEGSGFVVVDKPARVPVMPQLEGELGTVLNAAVARFPQLQGVGEGGLKSGVVHRLDTDTSGALLIATEEGRWHALRAAFSERRVKKNYRALVHGWLWGEGREVMRLRVASQQPARVRVVRPEDEGEGTRQCSLSWRVAEHVGDCTVLDVSLETGFLHQIRVMCAHKGHPVVGDALYGERGQFPAPRQMLHAARLEVDDVKAQSPLPEDFAAVLRELRQASQ